MLASILLILALVAASLAILLWVFRDPPASWEWVGVGLAAVSLAVAAPFVFQGIWGRPRVRTRIEDGAEGASRFLPVYLENPPVRNRVLKLLGVRREAVQSLTVSFRISEAGSGTIRVPIRQARIYSDEDSTDEGRDRITLPPTFSVAASIMIAVWDPKTNSAQIPPSRTHGALAVAPGYYQADIILLVDGEPQRVSRQFTVGQVADDLKWAPA